MFKEGHETTTSRTPDSRYVLIRSFHEREQHLRELEEFMKQLASQPAKIFLPDPLSTDIPSYHANLPPEVQKWVQGRNEVVNISTHRHPNGLDQSEESLHMRDVFVPNRYDMLCRNVVELDSHLTELEIQAGGEDIELYSMYRSLNAMGGYMATLPPPSTYSATLSPQLLQWVKGRGEVINIQPSPQQGYGDPEAPKNWLGRMMDWMDKKPGPLGRCSDEFMGLLARVDPTTLHQKLGLDSSHLTRFIMRENGDRLTQNGVPSREPQQARTSEEYLLRCIWDPNAAPGPEIATKQLASILKPLSIWVYVTSSCYGETEIRGLSSRMLNT
ncbi:hypothetical protein C8R43DRAFT_945706 [Mycena crocata]|nr:hypothetical protein C8R43DRAFT_945706 [Mycena crocata]